MEGVGEMASRTVRREYRRACDWQNYRTFPVIYRLDAIKLLPDVQNLLKDISLTLQKETRLKL